MVFTTKQIGWIIKKWLRNYFIFAGDFVTHDFRFGVEEVETKDVVSGVVLSPLFLVAIVLVYIFTTVCILVGFPFRVVSRWLNK